MSTGVAQMIATAPGKLILTGEYAVLDGAPAVVVAVDRRAVARRNATPRGSSPFLVAVAEEITARRGADDPAARAAFEISVDSTAFYNRAQKLGLGSSAAVTVAATALALDPSGGVAPRPAGGAGRVPTPHLASLETTNRGEILTVALAAHARAQGPRGARGSGADIAASVYGGTIAFSRPAGTGPCLIEPMRWPASVAIVPFFTGVAADTAQLVARVTAAREAHRTAVDAALAAIADASRAACTALAAAPDISAVALIGALALAADATDRLAAATRIDLVPGCVTAARAALSRLGGTAKTTGAGGGDVGIAVVPATLDGTAVTRSLIEAGCQPLRIALDDTGVDLRPDAS
jgi:phosphomevalonate kinase